MGKQLETHFQVLARYNRMANQRLYAKCAERDDAEYRKRQRAWRAVNCSITKRATEGRCT